MFERVRLSSRQLNLPRVYQPPAAAAEQAASYGGGHGGCGCSCGHGGFGGGCGGGGLGGLLGGGSNLNSLGLLAAAATAFYVLYSAITGMMTKRRRRSVNVVREVIDAGKIENT